jgi:hypothetical protein
LPLFLSITLILVVGIWLLAPQAAVMEVVVVVGICPAGDGFQPVPILMLLLLLLV